eukprot:3859844-Pyramimonas_sp.AAC.1
MCIRDRCWAIQSRSLLSPGASVHARSAWREAVRASAQRAGVVHHKFKCLRARQSPRLDLRQNHGQ